MFSNRGNKKNSLRPAAPRRKPHFEGLESRQLLSADIPGISTLLADINAPASALPGIHRDAPIAANTESMGSVVTASQVARELIVVDANVPDLQQLLVNLEQHQENGRNVEVLVLDANRDGLTQLTELLKNRRDISALHVISHGSAGKVFLGNSAIDTQSVILRSEEVRQWSASFTADADLLLYGCDVAANSSGRTLMLALSRMTGADVAASTDLTGGANRSGDWVLEAQTGAIESALNTASLTQWYGVLQLTPLGSETRVNTTTTNVQDVTDYGGGNVAMDATGNYVVVWNDANTNSGDIYFQRYNAAGVAQGSNTLVNTTTSNLQTQASVAMDANGNFVVTWTSAGQDGSAGGVYAQRFDASGVAQGSEFRVNTATTGDQAFAKVAMAADGSFVVAFTDFNLGDVFAQQYDSSGVAQGSNFRVNSTTTGNQGFSDVAIGTDGRFIITWESFGQDGDQNGVYGQRYDATGATVGSEFRANTTTTGLQESSKVAFAADDSFVVAWESQFSTIDMVVRKFNADGTPATAELIVNTTTADVQRWGDIAVRSDGAFIVTWQSANQDGSGLGIYAQEFGANGTKIGGEILVSTTTANDQIHPSAAYVSNNAVIVWSGNGSGDSSGVFAQRFSTAPVITVGAAQDTYIQGSNTGGVQALNYGTSTSLMIDRESTDLHRALLQFDVSAIPSNATIISATLAMQNTQIGGTLNINVYELLRAWTEGGSNGAAGIANWTQASAGTNWTAAGGDFNSTAVATLNTNTTGQHTWNLTSLVQAWVDGSKTNHGIVVLSPDGGGNRTATYDSSEGTTPPQLSITYTVPGNAAPVLDTGSSPLLTAQNEDSGAPSGAVGTLVSSLVDFASPSGQIDNVNDSDAGAQLGIAITGADTSNGSWWYSTNNGGSWSALGAVSNTMARLLVADGSTRVYFQPNANFNGTLTAALTFRAWDQTSGTNGGIGDTSSNGGSSAFSAATDTASLTINAVNDAPVNALPPNAYTALNTPRTFSTANGNALQVSDIDAGSGTLQFTLTATRGTLSLTSTAGLTLASGANGSSTFTYTGTLNAINTALGGGVTFTPTNGYRGLAQLTLQTSDLGNSGSGGTLTDSDTLTLHVGAIVVTNASDTSNGTTTSIANLIASDGSDGISLREAILAANATAGTDTIAFNITAPLTGGVHRIDLLSQLPDITQTVVIDGTTDPDFSSVTYTPVIRIDGSAFSGTGLTLNGSSAGSTIRGLMMTNNFYSGINVSSDNNVIVGNYIGTDGVSALGNGRGGPYSALFINANSNVIGGTTPADRNVVSGNSDTGIWIAGIANTLLGNYIGLTAAGTNAIANGTLGIGISSSATSNTIGGITANAANVISGNATSGMFIQGDNNTIVGNKIGTNAAGNAFIANGNDGIRLDTTANINFIGGNAAGAGNVIAGNGGNGVTVLGTGNPLLSNSIYSNGARGIDLDGDGVTLNDTNDVDTGGNNRQNFPVISANRINATQVAINGTLNSVASSSFRIEFFASASADPSGYGEGQRFLGYIDVNTDVSGNAAISTTLSGVAMGEVISATATRQTVALAPIETSEFSLAVAPALAQALVSPPLQGSETRVNTNTANWELPYGIGGADRVVAMNDNGQSVVIWNADGGQDGSGWGVFGQRYDASGAPVGGQFRLNTTTAGDQTNGAVAMRSDGSFVVVWSSQGQDGSGWGVYAQRYAANGAALGGEFRVNLTAAGDQWRPTVSMDANGNFVVAWSGDGTGDVDGIFARRYDSAGNALGGEFRVNTTITNEQSEVALDVNASGAFVITWSSWLQDGSGFGVYGQRYDATGATVGSEFRVNQSVGGTQQYAQVWLANNGSFVVLWRSDQGGTGNYAVMARRFDASGNALGSESTIAVDPIGADDKMYPTIDGDSSGNWIVAWDQSRDGSNNGIYARRYDASGNQIGGDFRVNTTTSGEQRYPGVAMNANGDFQIVWHGNGPGDGAGVFSQRYLGQARTSESGGNVSYMVVLDTAPTANVTIPVSSTNVLEGTVSASSLTFTPANWNVAQTMAVFGQDDTIVDGDRSYSVVLGAASSADPVYNEVDPADLMLTNTDNDTQNTIVVDTTTDINDGDTSSLSALLANKGADGYISLREAITATNNTTNGVGGPDRIHFAIGSGAATIAVSGSVLGISDAVIIDGTTQPGFAGMPIVRIDDAGGPTNDLLVLLPGSSGSTLRGLMVTRAEFNAIRIDSSNNVIVGNYLGTDGASAIGNGNQGIYISPTGASNIIGGVAPTDRNVIGGNGLSGIAINGSNNVVIGNYIGVGTNGSTPIGNGRDGVRVNAGSGNRIGGTTPNEGNIIANSGWNGIDIRSGAGTSHAVLGNRSFSNTLLGIDLGGDGVTLNDLGDADTGSNNLQNFPVLSQATVSGTNTTITGSLNSTANTTFRIEFFSSPSGDASGHGEASTYLGFANVTTNAIGQATINATLTGVTVPLGHVVTATATVDLGGGSFGSTSEFSANVTAIAPNTLPVNTVPTAQTTNEDQPLIITGISIAEADAGSSPLEVTLTVTNGTLTLSDLTGLTFLTGDGTADATMSFRGSIANLNAALASLTYAPTANYNGGATLTITSQDSSIVTLNVDSSLRGRYAFESLITPGADSSGAGNNGTLSGGAIVSDPTRGNVLSLSSGEYVQIPGTFGNPGNVTVAAWVNLSTRGTLGSEVINIDSKLGLRLDETTAGRGVGGWYFDGTTWKQLASGINIAGTGWHHVAYSFDDTNNTQSLYIDGVLVASAATSDSIGYAGPANSHLGIHPTDSNYGFTGRLDEARVVGRVLSASEIWALANDQTLRDTDTVAITVNAVNDPPIITSNGGGSTASISIPENTSAVTTVTSTDMDGGTPAYSIVGGADQSLFTINAVTGALAFIAPPNFESPADVGSNNIYDLVVQVNDGNGGIDTQNIAVTVTDVANTLVVSTVADTADGDTSSIEALNANKGADGQISLREAILAANNTAGLDTITFNIAGAGPHTINVSAGGLPAITGAVVIDGTSEPGYAGTPLIELNGAGAGAVDGLRLASGSNGSTIRGLVINRFGGQGIQIDSSNDLIVGNYIGVDVTGAIDLGNGGDGIYVSSGGSNNIIGGLTTADRNILSGNDTSGVWLDGVGNTVTGNYIGLNAAGNAAVGNQYAGVGVGNSSQPTWGNNNVISNNVISGTQLQAGIGRGIDVHGDNNSILSNKIGVDASGTFTIGNATDGIWIEGDNNIVGGSATTDRNIISGNGHTGVRVYSASGNRIQGNYFGTDITGMAGLGQGLSNIYLEFGGNHVIGGSALGEGNLIAASTWSGIGVWGSNNNVIQGNAIGLNAASQPVLGNGFAGIMVEGGSANNLIGGTTAANANTVSGSASWGIVLDAAGNGNAILGNRVYGNALLGIDIDRDGVTANDAGDADLGSNNSQNFPVLSSATIVGGQIRINGSLNSLASTNFRIELFANTLADPTGYGEGQRYLGYVNVVTDGAGNASFSTTLTASVANGEFISATATRLDGALNPIETSEFAQNVVAHTPGITVTPTSGLITTELGGTASFSVVLNAAPTADVTIAVTSSNTVEGTVSTSLLTFTTANWNVAQTATVTGQQDFVVDGNKLYSVLLASAVSADAAYNGIDPTDVILTNNESANQSPATNAPATISVTEDVASVITGISVTDVDAGTNPIQMRFSVPAGTFTAASSGGVTIAGSGTGTLTLTGSVTDINGFIAANNMRYTTAANANGTVTLTVTTDDLGNSGSGSALTDSDVVTLSITPVNDAPVLVTNSGLTLNEGASATVTAAMLRVTDVDNTSGQLVYTVTNTSTHGTLRLSGTALTAGSTFTQADIDSGRLTYDHDGSETTADSFDFAVDDGAGGTVGATAFAINVTPVDDPIVLSAAQLAVTANGSVVLANANFTVSDPDSTPGPISFTVQNVTNGTFEHITAQGVPITSFTLTEVVAGQIRFVHAGGNAVPSFEVAASDGTHTTPFVVAAIGFAPPPVVSPPPSNTVVLKESLPPPPTRPPSSTSTSGAPASPAPPGTASQTVNHLVSVDHVATLEPALLILQVPQVPSAERAAPVKVNSPSLTTISPPATLGQTSFTMKPVSVPTRETESTPELVIQEQPVQLLVPDIQQAFDEPKNDTVVSRFEVVLKSAQFAGVALSVGVVSWVLRAAGLLSSLLAALPAWHHMDPLPILAKKEKEEEEENARQEEINTDIDFKLAELELVDEAALNRMLTKE